MQKRLIRRKPIVVDDRRYEVSLTAEYAEVVQLRVTIRANYGTRSFVTIRGLTSYDYFHHYGLGDPDGLTRLADTVEVTPRLIAELVRFSLANGWIPDVEKTNRQFAINNLEAQELLAAAMHRNDRTSGED